MTWGASSATVRFSGASGVSVELDGRQEAAPAAHAWVYQTRKDLPAVFFQVSRWDGALPLSMHRTGAREQTPVQGTPADRAAAAPGGPPGWPPAHPRPGPSHMRPFPCAV